MRSMELALRNELSARLQIRRQAPKKLPKRASHERRVLTRPCTSPSCCAHLRVQMVSGQGQSTTDMDDSDEQVLFCAMWPLLRLVEPC